MTWQGFQKSIFWGSTSSIIYCGTESCSCTTLVVQCGDNSKTEAGHYIKTHGFMYLGCFPFASYFIENLLILLAEYFYMNATRICSFSYYKPKVYCNRSMRNKSMMIEQTYNIICCFSLLVLECIVSIVFYNFLGFQNYMHVCISLRKLFMSCP